jgi:hypothetical protein
MKSPRPRARLAALLLPLLLGCPASYAPSPFPALADTPDEGSDPGPLAACGVRAAAPTACGAPEGFDLSACDTASLARAPLDVALLARLRLTGPGGSGGASVTSVPVLLGSDGGVRLEGRPTRPLERGADGLRFGWTAQKSGGGTVSTTWAGCEARDGGALTGCYVSCDEGQVRSVGTWAAERVVGARGEGESRGLTLLSETPVQVGVPVDVFVTKGHAYVVSLAGGWGGGGLSVYSLEDRAAPRLVRHVTADPSPEHWNAVWARGDALYVGDGERGVAVFDITSPGDPRFVTALPDDGSDVHTLHLDGETLYGMSSSRDAVFVLDVSRPLEPELVARFTDPALAGGATHDATAFGHRLYVNGGTRGLVVLDAHQPSRLDVLGSYAGYTAYSHASAVKEHQGRTLVFEGGESFGAHLRVLDATNPADITLVGEYRLRDLVSIHNLQLAGDRLYVAHYQEGLRVLDVSDPTRPREVAHFNTFRDADPFRATSFYDGAIGVRVPGDGFVYVVDSSRGLLVFPALP